MILLGIVLLVVGYFLPSGLLFDVGLVLALIGALLAVFGYVSGPVYGRRHWW